MADSQGNPFIGNPFMQGIKKKPSPASEPELRPHRQAPTELSLHAPEQLTDPSTVAPTTATTPKQSASKSVKKSAKSLSKLTTEKPGSTATPKRASQSAAPAVATSVGYTGKGYKVQVLAKIPMPTNTNMPSRDYLWFAVYPIIPRVSDCIFHDGRYFRVDAVFLYESTNAGWCADLEVSYYTRRQ
ncbi:hypothetical protein [Leptothoe sp. PORK10 BA2]|uniref:hypothetical protein n=1 Tax=Leptothoe sp. PORK10 BA2 TaxID=3110254 RepID=UPI002B209397|nr:hypothetical protein [Leptothoe sp. PORK10 BA2]MEA5465022.1 hypothetical protein [Leptothoe sp. PORK10 BA2]